MLLGGCFGGVCYYMFANTHTPTKHKKETDTNPQQPTLLKESSLGFLLRVCGLFVLGGFVCSSLRYLRHMSLFGSLCLKTNDTTQHPHMKPPNESSLKVCVDVFGVVLLFRHLRHLFLWGLCRCLLLYV